MSLPNIQLHIVSRLRGIAEQANYGPATVILEGNIRRNEVYGSLAITIVIGILLSLFAVNGFQSIEMGLYYWFCAAKMLATFGIWQWMLTAPL